MANNRLFVGNLSFHTTEALIHETFSQFGEVVEVKLMTDRETGQSRGFAFVSMSDANAAQKAMSDLNGAMLEGRPLRVNEAEARPERSGGGGGGGGFGGPRGGGGGGGGGGRGGDRGGRGGDRRGGGGGGRW